MKSKKPITSAKVLYHSWMKRFGSCIGEHEGEVIADIERLYERILWLQIDKESLQEEAEGLVENCNKWSKLYHRSLKKGKPK